MAGEDLEIDAPAYVPLDIDLRLRRRPDTSRPTSSGALYEAFSDRVHADGARGFFHPDNFTFGQPVYLSQVIAAPCRSAASPGSIPAPSASASSATGQIARGEIAAGMIAMARLEIARLENDATHPENGQIGFDLWGRNERRRRPTIPRSTAAAAATGRPTRRRANRPGLAGARVAAGT